MLKDPTPIDPLHRVSGPATAWTRVNIAEGIPGVSTPLNWSWWDDGNERMIRGAYHDIGVLAEVEIPDVHRVDERASAIFFGRAALNVDVSRRLADLQPGTSGDALERHYFGAVRPDAVSAHSRRRYPAIALRLPRLWRNVPDELRSLYEETLVWWQGVVAPGAMEAVDRARAALADSQRRFHRIARPHSVLALLGGVLMQQVTRVAEAAGRPEQILEALGGYDSIEFETLSDLLSVRRGESSLEAFLRRHGYQGPQQGEISSLSWRENPAPLRALLETLDPGASWIGERVRERAIRRDQAEAAIARGLRPLTRIWARWLFSESARMLPERESGKAAMMLCIDAARACARRIGRDHAEHGRIGHPEDIFYLTLEEIQGEWPADAHALVAARRKQRDEYLRIELPESWVGMVHPVEASSEVIDAPLAGLGVSPGIADGIVRIVQDGSGELHPGEILVCTVTDPSYAAYFLVAGGVITDIGGAMGHGAIVAREVGIPCVVNARNATRRLMNGDRVRIDGTTGAIEILARQGETA